MKVFYHNDLDGECAAYWCSYINANKNKTFIKMNYDKPFPINVILPNETVYIVDFSIQPEEMKDLLEVTPNVVWIDHHKTAIEKYKDFPLLDKIKGIRYSDENEPLAACMLTYIYVMIMQKNNTNNFYSSFAEVAPYFTKLINDWDIWSLRDKNTVPFIVGCHLYDTNPESGLWKRLSKINLIAKIIKEGEICIRYRDNWAESYMRSFGFETEFEGYKCFCVNLGQCNSQYFKSIKSDKYDIYITFVFNGEKYNVSLYSTKIDVSEIAKKYGGGGHAGASGFTCSSLPFLKQNKRRRHE